MPVSVLRTHLLPSILDLRRRQVTADDGGFIGGVATQYCVSPDSHRGIQLQFDGISFGFQRCGVLLPGEGRHSRQDCEAILFDAGLVLFEPLLRAFLAAQTVDLLGGRLGPDADPVVAVQAIVHIDAVAVEMEMRVVGPCQKPGRNLRPTASGLPESSLRIPYSFKRVST